MHETVFANKIVEEAKKKGKVTKITVEVGELAQIPAPELKGTLAQMVDWDLNVVEKEASVVCPCGFEGRPKILEKGHGYTLFQCPECGTVPKVKEGEDIILKEVK